jgi:hypothetical protein
MEGIEIFYANLEATGVRVLGKDRFLEIGFLKDEGGQRGHYF